MEKNNKSKIMQNLYKLEETKWVVKSRKSKKDRQCNHQIKKDKQTNNDLQSTLQKLIIEQLLPEHHKISG